MHSVREVLESRGVAVIGGSTDIGVKGLGKANKTTLNAMIAIASSPSENR